MYNIRWERLLAMMGYVVFFVPLLYHGGSRFGRFHSNQGLVLLLLYGAFSLVAHIVPVIGKWILLPAAQMMWLGFCLLGMYHAWRGQMWRLPYIGGIEIIR